MNTTEYRKGDRVKVVFHPHEGDVIRLPGTVEQAMVPLDPEGRGPGPIIVKVVFDTPEVYGGTGTGWFDTDNLEPA